MQMLQKLLCRWQVWQQDEEGQAMTEYGLILALVAIVVMVILGLMGEQIRTVFTNVLTSLGGTVPTQ